jgi:hypothetical protein
VANASTATSAGHAAINDHWAAVRAPGCAGQLVAGLGIEAAGTNLAFATAAGAGNVLAVATLVVRRAVARTEIPAWQDLMNLA